MIPDVARPVELEENVLRRCELAVVILNYNTVGPLRDCLGSVFASQTDFRYQVYVVDNASADGSLDMVRSEFPDVQVIASSTNVGYSTGNNLALRRLGFEGEGCKSSDLDLPRFVLLLNPDTVVPSNALQDMLSFLDAHPRIGVAGPRVRRLDGSLDRACRRSFPTPQVSFYRMMGLSRLFPKSRRFNAYNLEYWAEDAVHPVDSVVGAFMLLRREAICQAGLLDESFFMYGEDLDWAKRIKDAGWQIWYNGEVEILHVKEAASSQSSKSRIDFYEAMWIFYRKHYRTETSWWLDKMIMIGIVLKGGMDVAGHLWRFCHRPSRPPSGSTSMAAPVEDGQSGTAPICDSA
jgi:GT2 family glycosyltransferase